MDSFVGIKRPCKLTNPSGCHKAQKKPDKEKFRAFKSRNIPVMRPDNKLILKPLQKNARKLKRQGCQKINRIYSNQNCCNSPKVNGTQDNCKKQQPCNAQMPFFYLH